MNFTKIYFSLLLPITLGYIEKTKKKQGEFDITPLVFLLILLAFNTIIKTGFSSNKWQMFWFNVKKVIK